MPDSALKTKFWQIGLADLERQLRAGRDGLSSAEAETRQLQYGPNTLEERRRVSLPLRFLSRFRNPLVLILLAAAAISALTGDLSSFFIIGAIVLTSAMLDTLQEYRAEASAERLKTSVALKEQVLRDGREITVPGRDLVPGDVVLLAAGDLVPADGRLIEAKDFFVNEALLTGESYPSVKMKISGCFRTLEGAQIFARLRSVVSTARKQTRNILQTLAASPTQVMLAFTA